MNNHVTLKKLIRNLDACKMKYEILELHNDWKIVVLERGGRVFGPFKNDDSESVVWINDVFNDEHELKAFVSKEGNWNLGGDRIWVTPEFPFFTKNREKFNETYTVQKGIDPACYYMQKSENRIKLISELTGELFERNGEMKSLKIEKDIKYIENPLRELICYQKYMEDVEYCGFEQEIYIEDISPEIPLEMEMWNLTQINPGGKIIVPFTKEFEFVDYYTPVDESILQVKENYAIVNINSRTDRKLNFKSANTMGRSAYINHSSQGDYLLVKNYFNDPSSCYVAEPSNKPGMRGTSLSIYIDGGAQGGFAEFENMGRTFGGTTGRNRSIDTVSYWFFFGDKQKLNNIIEILLGVGIRH